MLIETDRLLALMCAKCRSYMFCSKDANPCISYTQLRELIKTIETEDKSNGK